MKVSRPAGSSLTDAYPDALMQNIVVLCAKLSGSDQSFNPDQEPSRRNALQVFHDTATSVIEAHGGSTFDTSINAAMGCFDTGRDALEAAIALGQAFRTAGDKENPQKHFRLRFGIDFGEAIRDRQDVQGAVVDTATLLADLAGSGEIYVSKGVFELTRELPHIHFEVANIWNRGHLPEGLAVYKVIWDRAQNSDSANYPLLYIRPAWKSVQHDFSKVWESLIGAADVPWKGQQELEGTLPDRSLVLILKHIDSALPIAATITVFLREKARNLNDDSAPVRILADIGPFVKQGRIDAKDVTPDWEKLDPGYLYLTERAFASIKQKSVSSGIPFEQAWGGQPFYRLDLAQDRQDQKRIKRFLYQKSLIEGQYEPCFYCGDRKHRPSECPSKGIAEVTHALNRLGYLSIDELNRLFYRYIAGADKEGKTTPLSTDLTADKSLDLAACGFFDLKKVFQLRFFRSIWNAGNEEWNKIRENRSQSEGGFAWLAQDSLRVSDLGTAESILANAMEKNPFDYRVHVIAAFLYIEKGDLPGAERRLNEALNTARTNLQKAFVLLLLSRLSVITGNLSKASERLQKVFALDIESFDVSYQDIVLKFYEGKDKIASQRLIKLIQHNRDFYVATLIDPDLVLYSHGISELLDGILIQAKKDAEAAVSDAENEFALSKTALGRSELNDIQLLKSKIEELLKTNSYFGYLDIADHANSIIVLCRNGILHRKREISKILQGMNERLGRNLAFIQSYPYQVLTNPCREQLATADERIRHLQSTGPAMSQEQLLACHNLQMELSQEWDRMESRFQRLETLREFLKGVGRFFKWSVLFIGIVWFMDLFIFPLIIYYTSALVSGFEGSSLPNVWFYQKTFLVVGSVISTIIALFIAAKNLFKGN
ncbi:MAG: hypothetical protein A4E63_00098 [Syntrophorhabdus sp. PtaU1.Bin050]|nr:MAG: hypothetical protein A4E63_00098 [Syntrophorhabdus sp. PtaU1.Bin050]